MTPRSKKVLADVRVMVKKYDRYLDLIDEEPNAHRRGEMQHAAILALRCEVDLHCRLLLSRAERNADEVEV